MTDNAKDIKGKSTLQFMFDRLNYKPATNHRKAEADTKTTIDTDEGKCLKT